MRALVLIAAVVLPVSLSAVAISGIAAPCRAEAPSPAESRARALFRRAEAFFDTGEFRRALELYRDAYHLSPAPALLFNIGQCQRFLGEYERAEFSYRLYLEREPSPPHRAEVERLITEMQHARAAERRRTSPQRARAGAPPRHAASAERPGPARTGGRWHPAWLWTTGGVAVAGLIASTLTGVLTAEHSREYNDPVTSIERRRELKSSGEALNVAFLVSLGLSLASGATAAALAIWGRPASSSSPHVSPAPGAPRATAFWQHP